MGFISHWEDRQRVKIWNPYRWSSSRRGLHLCVHGKGSTGWGALRFSLLSTCGMLCFPGNSIGGQLSSVSNIFFPSNPNLSLWNPCIHTGVPVRSFPPTLIHLPQATHHLSVYSTQGSVLPTAFQKDNGQARSQNEGRTGQTPLPASGSTCQLLGLKFNLWCLQYYSLFYGLQSPALPENCTHAWHRSLSMDVDVCGFLFKPQIRTCDITIISWDDSENTCNDHSKNFWLRFFPSSWSLE